MAPRRRTCARTSLRRVRHAASGRRLRHGLTVSIRAITEADSARLEEIIVLAWESQVLPYLGPSWRHRYDAEELRRSVRQGLRGAHIALTATSGARKIPVGFILAGEPRAKMPATLEIYKIYVHPSSQRRGVGAALFKACLENALPLGGVVGAWVACGTPAEGFYHAMGWKRTAAVRRSIFPGQRWWVCHDLVSPPRAARTRS